MASTWPDGVLYRALTAGGATVDITLDTERSVISRAVCTGCPETEKFRVYICDAPSEDAQKELAIWHAVTWARKHAPACVFLPRPAGTP